MDHDLTRTAPSALAGTATGLGYSLDSVVLLTIAQYIRNLGYQAIPSMNDTALAIPYALEAGLGEYGRHGLLMTPEFGPRLRLGKIFTDMPLQRDHPKSAGVERFCDGCPVHRSVPGEGDSRWSADDRSAQPIQPHRCEEVVGRRGEVLFVLDEGQHRLLRVHPGLPLQP